MLHRTLMKPSPSFLRLLLKTRKSKTHSSMHRTLSLRNLSRIKIAWLRSWETSKPPRLSSKRLFLSSCQAWLCRALKALWKGSRSSWASNSSKCSKRSSARFRVLMVTPESEQKTRKTSSISRWMCLLRVGVTKQANWNVKNATILRNLNYTQQLWWFVYGLPSKHYKAKRKRVLETGTFNFWVWRFNNHEKVAVLIVAACNSMRMWGLV